MYHIAKVINLVNMRFQNLHRNNAKIYQNPTKHKKFSDIPEFAFFLIRIVKVFWEVAFAYHLNYTTLPYHTHETGKENKVNILCLMASFGFHINDLAAWQGWRIALNQSASKSAERYLLIAMTFSWETKSAHQL